MDSEINLVFTYVLIGVLSLVLWGEASNRGVVTWAAFLGLVAPLPNIFRALDVSFRVWFRLEILGQAIVGLAWGSSTVFALPERELYQGLLTAALIGVLVASSAGESQFNVLYLSFMVPFAGLAGYGVLSRPYGLALCAVFLAVAFVFSVISAHGHRQLHVGFVDLLVENEALVAELEAERDAMADANRRLDRMAWTDSLTGLANRAAMQRDLEDALSSLEPGRTVTVAYLDLDGFKAVNDRHGHRVGDQLLSAVASRLRSAVEAHELACRLGGDELTVVARDTEPAELGERLAAVFDEPYQVDGRVLGIECGIGLASTTGRGSADDLVRRADRALYRHKADQHGSARFEVDGWTAGPQLRSLPGSDVSPTDEA